MSALTTPIVVRSAHLASSSEINAARENPHLYRAVIRTLHRPLSVLVTNVSGTLLPLIASPAFLTPAVPTPQLPHPNPTQLHAVALATFAGELLETFDELGLGQDSDMRGDGLKSVKDSLVSIIQRVIDPLVSGIKNDLMPHIEALEQAAPGVAHKTAGAAKTVSVHPSIAYMHVAMPLYARALSRYIASKTAETTLASLLISLVWRGLVALSHRPLPPTGPTPPGSPPLGPLSKADARRRGSSATPPPTPPPGRFTLKLPPSRPPSPPGAGTKAPSAAADARALYDLLALLPRPSNALAREAVGDAFASLSGTVALLDFVHAPAPAVLLPSAALGAELDRLTLDVSTLVALPILLRTLVFPHVPGGAEKSVAAMLGLSAGAYRSGCLSGFGRAEECAVAVGQRVLGVLRAEVAGAPDVLPEAVLLWLEREIAEAAGEQQQMQH